MPDDLLTPLREEPPTISAADALRRLEIMIACMDLWQTRRGETAQLMGGWAQWLRCIKPHVEAAAERSNMEPARNA